MRVVKEIPGVEYNTTIYSWNNKFIIKFESGPYEQTYKISELDLLPGTDLGDVVADPGFKTRVIGRFEEMDKDFGGLMSDFV
ncbi:MAG: hypothetical protein AAFO69_04370 [Bacteroidota bacterium]